MKSSIRTLLIPTSLVLIIVGIITGKWLIFGLIAGAILLFSVLFYSHRKQRVRYWVQGYQLSLEKNGGDELGALKDIRDEFCTSKYAEERICKTTYSSLDILVEDIIKCEFKFEVLLQPMSSNPKNIEKNMHAYMKAKGALKKEIEDVKKEVLGSVIR